MRLWEVVRRSPPLVKALHAAHQVDAPQWLITAGAIRDAVWDALHDRPLQTLPRDLDFAFFDRDDLAPEGEDFIERQLRLHAPDLPWDVKNQASVHLWYPDVFGSAVQPFTSCAEAVATFPETATCVGVRLIADGDLLVVAPHGLADLLGGVCRHNPTRVSEGFYRRRIRDKGWRARWPKVEFVGPPATEAAGETHSRSCPGSPDPW